MNKRVVGAAAAIALLTACGDSTEPRVPTAVQLDRQAVTLEFGDTLTLHATVVDQNGRAYDVPPQGFTIGWSSSAPGVASVNNAGRVTATGYGLASISAQAGGLPSAQAQVEVEPRLLRMQMAFAYNGDLSGTVAIDETERLDEIDWFGNWTLTEYNTQFDDQDIIGQRLRPDGLYDILYFWVDGRITSAGTHAASDGVFVIGFDADENTEEGFFQITSGAVVFDAVDTRTMRGTFSLGLQELLDGDMLGEGVIDITDGTFDLPLVTEAEFAADPGPGQAALVQLPASARERFRDRIRFR